MNTQHNGHKETAEFSPEQQAMFFAVAQELGYSAREVKERAKNHFNYDCFNKLRVSELSQLIDKLEQQKIRRKEGLHQCYFEDNGKRCDKYQKDCWCSEEHRTAWQQVNYVDKRPRGEHKLSTQEIQERLRGMNTKV